MTLDCSADIQFGLSFFQPLSLVCLLLIAYGTFAFLEDQKEKKRKVNKWHNTAMLAFFFFAALDVLVGAIGIWRFCEALPDMAVKVIMPTHTTLAWAASGTLYMAIMYMRLLKIFDGTNYELAKCTKCVFNFFFVTMLLLTTVTSPLTFVYHIGGRTNEDLLDVLYALAGLILFLTFVVNISMVLLFVGKLFSTVKLVAGAVAHSRRKGAKRDRIIGSIAKLTVLSLISLTVSFLAFAVFIAAGEDPKKVSQIDEFAPLFVLTSYLHLADVMTNFMCITFFFQRIAPVYGRLCGRCDLCCSNCVTRCVFGKESDSYSAKDPKDAESDREADEETATTATTGTAGTGTNTDTPLNSVITVGSQSPVSSSVHTGTMAPPSMATMGSVQLSAHAQSALSAGSDATLNEVHSTTITQTQSQTETEA